MGRTELPIWQDFSEKFRAPHRRTPLVRCKTCGDEICASTTSLYQHKNVCGKKHRVLDGIDDDPSNAVGTNASTTSTDDLLPREPSSTRKRKEIWDDFGEKYKVDGRKTLVVNCKMCGKDVAAATTSLYQHQAVCANIEIPKQQKRPKTENASKTSDAFHPVEDMSRKFNFIQEEIQHLRTQLETAHIDDAPALQTALDVTIQATSTNMADDEQPEDVELDSPREPSDNNIRIFLRIKPSKKVSGFFSWAEEESQIEYNIPKDVASGLINNSRTHYKFKFDALIGMEAKQEEVFDRVGRPCVQNALDGFNSTIFAYGQTGSGKTFTITGGAERYEDRGIIPRSLSMIFEEMRKHPEKQITAYISYLEIYNNSGYDLLNEDHQNTKDIEDLPKVSMLEDEDGNCHLRNLSMHRVATEEEALNLLFLGDTNRAVSETSMNLASSRSHCIFTVSLESRRANSEVILRSKLHMVDLAGSERAHKTGAKGKVLREATYINTSLHYLEMVIVALHEKNTKGRTHIPYRNSMMTSVLRDSLGGNCKTIMIATASAEKEQTDESLSTCRFAQRVARVRNDAHLNEEVDPAIVIRRLKAQIVSLQEEISILKGETKEGDELKDYEKEKLYQKVLDYANSRDPEAQLNMGDITYMKMKLCFGYLKQLYQSNPGGSNESNNQPSNNNQTNHNIVVGSTPEIQARIVELEQTIQQRDNEIAILVNMLKKGEGGNQAVVLQKLKEINKQPNPSISTPNQKPPPPLNGFDVKIDPVTLDNPTKAFEVFRDQYPKNDVIRENKALLKKKYDQAKTLAAKVNEARNAIKDQTTKMEKIRKDKAVASVTEGDQVMAPSEDEKALLNAIDAKKQEYKTGFNQLNELKKEIQHIQKMLEMSRIKLQKDFDEWYQAQGKGHLLTESLVKGETLKQEESTPKKPPPKAAWPPESPTQNQVKEVPKTGMNDVDKDVSGFYEALDILKRRNSRK